jgi:hypothetical protein
MLARIRILAALTAAAAIIPLAGCSKAEVDDTPTKVTNIPKKENFPTPVPLRPGQLVPTGDENMTKQIAPSSGDSISQAASQP